MIADGEKVIIIEKMVKNRFYSKKWQKVEFIEIYRNFQNFTIFYDFWTPGTPHSVL
jgi:hypothetical protein